MPGTDVTGGPPGASGFARDHLYRRDPSNGLGQVVYSRLIAYQPSTLSFIDLTLDASGNLNTAGGSGGGGAVTVADGADVTQGAVADVAVITDANGTISGKLRGLVKWAFERMPASLGQKAMAASLPVVVASDQTVIPVSDNAGSLTVDAPVGTPVWVRLSDGAAAFVGQKAMAASIPVVIASDQSALPAIATGANRIGKVIIVDSADGDQTQTKGSQTARFLGTQDAKDSGRVNIALTIEFAFAQVAETLLTVTESRDGAATATFTSKTITSGKRIRFTGGFAIIETLGTGTTVPQRMYLRLRVNTAGATIATSPLQYVWGLGIATGSAAIPVKASTSAPIVIPDGVEYAGNGTVTYGLTLETPDWVVTTGTGRCKITLFAFEY